MSEVDAIRREHEDGGFIDANDVGTLLAEIERLRAVSEDHRLAMVESDRQRDKARAREERPREGIRAVADEMDRGTPTHTLAWEGDLRALLDDREDHE